MAKIKRVLMIITHGVEDVEFTTPRDVMIRAGLDVDVAMLTEDEYLRTSYGLELRNKTNLNFILNSLEDYTALFIPGGPGTSRLDLHPKVDQIIEHFVKQNKPIGAICAAPTLLAKRGYLEGKKAICFNDKELRTKMQIGGAIIENPDCEWGQTCEVVKDGQFMTGLMYRTSLPMAIRFTSMVKKW